MIVYIVFGNDAWVYKTCQAKEEKDEKDECSANVERKRSVGCGGGGVERKDGCVEEIISSC